MNFHKKYIALKFHSKLSLYLILAFVLSTIIGTLTHEMGHIAFAKAHGYSTHLGYGYMTYGKDVPADIKKISEQYPEAIEKGLDFPEKERWEEVRNQRIKEGRWITFGGPFQTVVFGSIGLFLLYRRKQRIIEIGMAFTDWVLVFLSLFWLREWYNPMASLVGSLLKGKFNPFGGGSDELDLARSLNWWEGSISLPLALIAVAIALYVIFKIIPKTYRLTFLVSGLVGGLFGFFFWLEWVGPVLMP